MGGDGLRCLVLGALEVWLGDEQVQLGGRMQRSVLADLVVHHPDPVSLSRLIDDLWPDDPPPSAESTVYAYVSRLRKALGSDAIERAGDGYRLHLPPNALDVEQFESLVDEASTASDAAIAVELYRQALELWRGEPFGELGFEPFLAVARARLVELRDATLEDHLSLRMEFGEADPTLIGDLERAVAIHPLREGLWELLMRALYRDGRQADALRAYRRVSVVLGEQLGIEPGDPLRRLEDQILVQHPGLDARVDAEDRKRTARVPTNLRTPVTSFVGRDELTARVSTAIEEHRLVTMLGPGGVGKTRAAVEVAWTRAPELTGGVWEIDLLSTFGRTGPLDRLASALGIPEAPGSGLQRLVARRLADHPTLVLVDNCEHLIGDVAGFVGWLLSSTETVRVLATSREALGLAVEHLVPVPPLLASDEEEHPGVLLFIERARAVRRGFRPLPEDRGSIARLVEALDGLPLAIEIAAAHTALLSVAEILERIEADRTELATRSTDPRHETLSSMIDWSFHLLDQPDRSRFLALATFAGIFDVEAAGHLWRSADEHETSESLDRLIKKSLVQESDHVPSGPRYRLLDTVRSYGRRRLDQEGAWEDLTNRHLQWVEGVVIAAAAQFHGPAEDAALGVLRARSDEVSQAIDFASSDPDTLERLAHAVWYWWFLDGRPTAAIDLLDRCLAIRPDIRLASARLLIAAEHGHEPADAIVAGAAELVGAAADAPPGEAAETLLLVGDALTSIGEYEAADAPLRRAAALYHEMGIGWGEGWALLRLVRVAGLGRGDDGSARALLAEARQHLDAAGDARLLAYAEIIDASIARLHGRWGDTLEFGLRAVETFRRLQVPTRHLEAAIYPALAYIHLGHAARADELIDEISQLARSQGDGQSIAAADLLRATWSIHCGDPIEAVEMLQDQLATAEQTGDRYWEGRVAMELAEARLASDRPLDAAEALETNVGAWEGMQQPWMSAQTVVMAGEIALARQDIDEAQTLLETGLSINQSLGQLHIVARGHEGLALVAQIRGDATAAMSHLAMATSIRDQIGAPLGERRRRLHRDLSAWGLRELGADAFQRLWEHPEG